MVNLEELKKEVEFIDNRIDQGHIEKTKEFLEKLKEVPELTKNFDTVIKRLIITATDIEKCLNKHQENYYYSNLNSKNEKQLEELDILIENLNMSLINRKLIIENTFYLLDHFRNLLNIIDDYYVEYDIKLFYKANGDLIDLIKNNYYENEWVAIDFTNQEFIGHDKSRTCLIDQIKKRLKDVKFFYCDTLEEEEKYG